MKRENIYIPNLAEIKGIRRETPDVKTFQISFVDKRLRNNFHHIPGQFLEISLFGFGEIPISISSSPSRRELEVSVKNVGYVTSVLHEAEVGDIIGIRGPYGNGFPVDELRGRDILFIGGGIGLAPLRSLINFIFDNRGDFGKVYLLYGARTPEDIVFKDDIEVWKGENNSEIHLTVDHADEEWKGNVGVVPTLLEKISPKIKNTIAIICGPPIMIKFTVKALLERKFGDEQIIFTLERMMKCGVGKCGHCNIGEKYVCIDGPVFRYSELRGNPDLGF
ncbi:MAG: hydrogenase [Candidatus Altiarchaeales archaeon]|nr:MAG: hydrogenase [Candidatus Altiarchaeales archaeon]RLI94581.1 MAG: hydrogenase [Candidatus Altiarchaeales archaeon]RLI95049.1 MAG: hydrogenase [Candidatus Altiarchaeales archaeon]HDO82142.1 hydrogenase [Candidatus Altiarchaeales archaeon]HEX54791.1 hydrogenase [Candidatus Altiarchaeales archaeon]